MSIKVYHDQKKSSGQAPDYVTGAPVRAQQVALDSACHEFVQSVATDAVEAGSTTTVINATSHVARRGDVIRITSGTLAPLEVAVAAVATNTITLAEELPSAPSAADTFAILRFTRPVVDSSGQLAVGVTAGPVQYNLNGVATTVAEDTATPANDRPLPTKLIADGGGDIAFGSGASGTNVLRTVLATRHEAVATPLAAQLSNGSSALDYDSGAAGSATLRAVLATRHEALATPLAAQLSNGSAALDYGSGASGAATLRTVLATRHEAVATPLAVQLSTGSAAVAYGAGAAGATVPRVETAAADATYQARGKIAGTSLTGSYSNLLTTTGQAVVLALLNTCNQTILISFDSGTTDHVELEAGESLVIDFGANNRRLASGTEIDAKHGGVAPTQGSVRATVIY